MYVYILQATYIILSFLTAMVKKKKDEKKKVKLILTIYFIKLSMSKVLFKCNPY